MKLKGIGVFEQHVEKIFAAIIFIALLGLLAWQFLSGPTLIKVGKREVPLNQVWEAVANDARNVQAALNSTREPDVGDAQASLEGLVKFNETFRGPVAPAKSLDVAFGLPTTIGNLGSSVSGTIARLPEIVVPAPAAPQGNAHLTLISPAEAESSSEIAAILPPAMPFDKAGVSVEALFNGAELAQLLAADPDGDGPIQAMPRHWYDIVQILDVILEREELGADGQWVSPTTVPPLPGKYTLRPTLAEPIAGAQDLKDLARLATESAEWIRRTPYYLSAMGEKWLPPTEQIALDERLAVQAGNADDAQRLRRTVANLIGSVDRARQELANLGAGGGRTPPPAPGGGGGGSGGGGKGIGGGGGSGGGGDGGRERQTTDPNDRRRRELERRIEREEREIARVLGTLRGMNEDVSMYGVYAQQGDQPGASETTGAAAASEAPLLSNPAVRIWAHDVNVERGKTYRYRLRVAINNPMFGQSNVMVPEQQELAGLPTLVSEPSDWSDPIHVHDQTYYFITSANAADRLNRTPSARAEMFIFKWGRWRKGDVSLEPGDRLQAEIKYPDVSTLVAMAPGANPGEMAPPAAPMSPKGPMGDPGSGRRPRRPPGRRRDPLGRGPGRRPRQPAGPRRLRRPGRARGRRAGRSR